MERAVPILPADDLGVSRDFYINKLGFDLLFEWSADGVSGIIGVGRGQIQITLDSPMEGHGRHACVSLEVASADAYYEEWREQVEIDAPPKNEDWGARTFSVTDPAGNTIFVMGPTTPE